MFKRAAWDKLLQRLQEKRQFIQVITGPRQVGKTTLIQQVAEKLKARTLYASADEPTLKNIHWIEQQWSLARIEANHPTKSIEVLLIFDEIQKIPGWSEKIKHLWDEDTHHKLPLKVILLGSAPLLIKQGLTESLAGRFEQIPLTHWSFVEMHNAFGWNLDQYIYFGGYPGAHDLIKDETRWKRYINDALIETTLSRDILLLNNIHKPALLRQLFQLSCDYAGQILSYQKMIGQLDDAGNTTTLSHYLELLQGVGMVAGISKFHGSKLLQRASSPKLQPLNTALISARSERTFQEARKNLEYWGRLVESAVGAYLLNSAVHDRFKVYYWRERDQEVDFILQFDSKIIALEIKSGMRKSYRFNIDILNKHFKIHRSLLIGGQGMPLEKFFTTPIIDLF